ncbi:gamma-aminobutyrate dehydratase [Egibacter rhizosphaerae]|uniref:Gamma-aminobutyrate dehydratase n=1 Tax=Egibacter rhizosphaerae TaxID=1670831 RepID=A0A411YBF3_9ACTN|nr:4-hydroxyphenylacetate 3-hydroxylase N-terminal domain-containing protein [Egibacter rhizosphaerae]QBI18529.1 gamma-aminobutyrate dehydratase [Egibacter rhizosphaerae]
MGLRTADQYLKGLRDDRRVRYRGETVEDVVAHPELGLAARHASLDFALAERASHSDLAIRHDGDQPYSAYFQVPRTTDDLAARSALVEAATREGDTLVLLIKEIGTDALFALMRVLERYGLDEGQARVHEFHRHCRDGDLSLAVAQTDVKGDRSKGPSEQADPDLNLRVVETRDEGIVVRGAKSHTSCSPYVDELLVLPSRRMRPGEEDWAVAFAVPVDTPGLTLYAADFLHGDFSSFDRPVSSRHKMIETLTVFDDVLVPWDRVFLHGEAEAGGATALTFVEYHRFTAVSYKLPLLDALVGTAIAVAEANGIGRAGHVRDKLTWLAGYAETARGLIQLAAQRGDEESGIAYPDVFTTNLAKWTFARDIHYAFEVVQDLAGGLLVTGPSAVDWQAPEIRPILEKYLAAAWPAADRMAVMNLARDLTTDLYGGYQAVLALHAEGSLEAEKLQMYRAYDHEPALTYALGLAGLRDTQDDPTA